MNEAPPRGQPEPNSHSGYSLSSLFLLLALFGVVSAHISPLLNAPAGEISPQDPLIFAVICGVSGAALGMIVGLHHYQRLRGLLLGLPLGLTFGAFVGPVVAASMTYPQQTLWISAASGVVLLTLAAWIRRVNDDDPVSRKYATWAE